ncbi:hypothetical protein K431DRAFT_145593 [Polychaeton citri CBS 116435]|uniref:Uncharacterized protein n=1 Tax=Polychaeton citri CBS 116435 TaxID=1314669 RepID=A0A9P4QES1_9PEZI|nr:hypothetical protein K431DRAFT_145593 [Polychaeton citri CBS 116435]
MPYQAIPPVSLRCSAAPCALHTHLHVTSNHHILSPMSLCRIAFCRWHQSFAKRPALHSLPPWVWGRAGITIMPIPKDSSKISHPQLSPTLNSALWAVNLGSVGDRWSWRPLNCQVCKTGFHVKSQALQGGTHHRSQLVLLLGCLADMNQHGDCAVLCCKAGLLRT